MLPLYRLDLAKIPPGAKGPLINGPCVQRSTHGLRARTSVCPWQALCLSSRVCLQDGKREKDVFITGGVPVVQDVTVCFQIKGVGHLDPICAHWPAWIQMGFRFCVGLGFNDWACLVGMAKRQYGFSVPGGRACPGPGPDPVLTPGPTCPGVQASAHGPLGQKSARPAWARGPMRITGLWALSGPCKDPSGR